MSSTPSLNDMLHDVLIGTLIGSSHSLWYVQNWVKMHLIEPVLFWKTGTTSNIDTTRSKDAILKVVGVGYGRTGTYSLTMALEEVGFPTLHTRHLYEDAAILDMWTDQVFRPSIESEKASLGSPDLNLIAQHGFQATMDLPTALYFESLLDNNETKFILTTRESSEVWYNSWDTLTKAMTVPTRKFGWMSHAKKINLYYRWLFALVNQDDSYLTTPMPLPAQNKARAIQSYEAHNARVRELVPPERLLEYSVKQGWEPLCEFLEIQECPLNKPFPKSNSALSVRVQAMSAMVVPITVVVLVIFIAVAFVWRKQQNKKGSAEEEN